MIRNLLYNCCPLESGADIWRDNVEFLHRYSGIFNNRRIVIIRTGEGLEPPEAVKELFRMPDIEFVELPNDRKLQEVSGFIETLGKLESLNPEEITFYAHTKGVKHAANGTSSEGLISIRQWRNRMYHECLSAPDKIDSIMKAHPACGCFVRKVGPVRGIVGYGWLFSGTFYWVKHSVLFKRSWKNIIQHKMGTERYPSVVFDRYEVCELYKKSLTFDLYKNFVGTYDCPNCGKFDAKVTENVLCVKCGSMVGKYVSTPDIGIL